jgi:hypothetical protein
MQPQALWTGGAHASPRPQRSMPALNATPLQVGCPFSQKEKWQRMWRHASLKASLDLTDSSLEQSGETAAHCRDRRETPQRLSVRCQSTQKTDGQQITQKTDGQPPVTLRQYLSPVTADMGKEKSMVYRRTVFGHSEWLRHRSTKRHYRHILSIAQSRVILALGPTVLTLTGIALAIALYNEAVINGVLPHDLPLLRTSPLPLQLTTPASALLLVFRINASYGRFDEVSRQSTLF